MTHKNEICRHNLYGMNGYISCSRASLKVCDFALRIEKKICGIWVFFSNTQRVYIHVDMCKNWVQKSAFMRSD